MSNTLKHFILPSFLFVVSLACILLTTYLQISIKVYGVIGAYLGLVIIGWLFLGGLSWVISRDFKGILLLRYVLFFVSMSTLLTVLIENVFYLDQFSFFSIPLNLLVSFLGLIYLFKILTPHIPSQILYWRVGIFLLTWQGILFSISHFAPKQYMKYSVQAPSVFSSIGVKSIEEFNSELLKSLQADLPSPQ
jgi:hypothetical protein